MKKLILIISLLLGWQTVLAQLIINELMQSNVDCIMDDLNDFPDSWVELYNNSSEAINLKDYKLGITDKSDEAWLLPDHVVPPKMWAIVYCDKVGQGMHTSFRLDTGKGSAVYLFRSSEVIDQVTDLQKQPAPNIAYGRQTDGSHEWGYQLEPTPGATNCGKTSDKILGDPVFSEPGSVFKSNMSVTLELSLPKDSPEGTEIRMTFDGTEPTKNSTLYTEPIQISNTKIIRAKLFCDGWLSPRSVTQSYINLTRQQTLPLISITTDGRYLTDSNIGIYVEGSYQSGKKNYEFNWRRPLNIELFEGEGQTSVINQLCETRVSGGASRGSKLKSLILYAHKRFGKKHFDYEIFPDQKPGIHEFKSFMLRNAGNDFDYLFMRDAIIQRTMASHADLDWQAWQPAIIFINGVYKGMLNIRERSNEDNIWSNYNKLEDIDMVENWKELKTGDMAHYNRFMDFCKEKGHTMAEYEKWMDCSEFANLMLMNLYYNNYDMPGNNWMMWRPHTDDGRWRFVAKDVDFGLGLYGNPATFQIIDWMYNPNFDPSHNWANTEEATRLFRYLMEDPDFFKLFIDRASVYMGDFLNNKGTRAVWDPMYELFISEFTFHRMLNRVNEWWPRKYDEDLLDARNWLIKRTDVFYTNLGTYYKLGTPINMNVNMSVIHSEEVEMTFNGIRLSRGLFDGKFFPDREVTLQAKAPEGKVVKGWELVTYSSSGTESKMLEGEQCSFKMPNCISLSVNAKFEDASAINTIGNDSWTWMKVGSRLILSGVPEGTSVMLYDLRGMLLFSDVANGSEMELPLSKGLFHVLKVGGKAVKLQ